MNKTTDRLLTVAIIIAFVLLFIAALAISKVEAHDVHLIDVQDDLCQKVAGPWYADFGAIFATKCDDSRTQWWVVYKDGDLTHNCLHARMLTQSELLQIMEVK